MRRTLLLLLWIIAWSARGDFDAARAAYDAGDFAGALAFYESLPGFSPEIDFNAGNALMRLGRTPEAIARYRRALWLRPGDPEVRANLDRAVRATGAMLPPLPPARRFSGFLSPRQWRVILMVCCWLLPAYALAARRLKRLREAAAWVLPLLTAGLLCAAAGVWASRPAPLLREAVARNSTLVVRFEPLPDATEHFSLPGGSVLRITGESQNWFRVEAEGRRGWAPAGELLLLRDL